MKSQSTFLSTVLVCAVVLLAGQNLQPIQSASAAGNNPVPSPNASCSAERSVSVSGTAVVNVAPDRVLIQLGLQSNGRTPQLAEAANSATVHRITRAIKKIGVAEKDIVTDRYVIDPVYNNNDSLIIKGYRIHNIVAITLRDIDDVNEVMIAAIAAGANQVVNVEFYLSDLRKYRDQARELAMIAAGEKASNLAEAAGTETGCVLNISENTWSYFSGGWWGRNNNLWTQNSVQNIPTANGQGGDSDFGPVNLGLISVRAEVSASYALR